MSMNYIPSDQPQGVHLNLSPEEEERLLKLLAENPQRHLELKELPPEMELPAPLTRFSVALEGHYGEDQQRIAQTALKWIDTLLRKNHDYGCTVWDTPILAPDLDPASAIFVRMSDKIARLNNLRSTNAEVTDESIEDTISDLGSYALLLLARPKNEGANRENHNGTDAERADDEKTPTETGRESP